MRRFGWRISQIRGARHDELFDTLFDYPGAKETSPRSISNSGEIVGVYGNSGYFQGFSEAGGVFTKVDYPNTMYSTFPYGVNSNGDIVGGADTSPTVGFLDKGGVFTEIKVPGASGTTASAINDNGEIVGSYLTDKTHSFAWKDGGITTFDVPFADARVTYANGVNDAGVIVGDYYTTNNYQKGLIDDGGNFVLVAVPGALTTVPEAINNKGDVAGYYTLADGTTHGFVFSNASFSTIDIAGADTYISGINDAGQVVGSTGSATDGSHDGFIATPLCFAAGTAIRTTRGDVAVEALAVGDHVVTATGALRLVRWLGHRTIDCRGAAAAKALPIRIVAHAFGPGLPARDLVLSPGHPVLVGADEDGEGGHLVPIMCLVNGTTVRRDTVGTVTYWHVELDAHDILLAEGLPAESYLDWGDRAFFTEGSDHALHDPDLVVPGLAGRCRPVATDGPVVEAKRARLDAVFALRLAAMSGWPTEAGLSLGF